MPSSYNLPEIVKKERNRCTGEGRLLFKSDVVKDAMRTLLEKKENMRVAAAVELFRRSEVSLGKAAEIADLGVIEFKERLADLGITRIKSESAKKMDKELRRFQRKARKRSERAAAKTGRKRSIERLHKTIDRLMPPAAQGYAARSVREDREIIDSTSLRKYANRK